MTEEIKELFTNRASDLAALKLAQAAYALGVAQGKVEALTFADTYTDGAYAGVKAERGIRESEVEALLARLRGEEK